MEAAKCRSSVDITFLFPIALVELEKREEGRAVCVVCKIDSSIGTSNYKLMEWMSVTRLGFLDSNRGLLSTLWYLCTSSTEVSVIANQEKTGETKTKEKGKVT